MGESFRTLEVGVAVAVAMNVVFIGYSIGILSLVYGTRMSGFGYPAAF